MVRASRMANGSILDIYSQSQLRLSLALGRGTKVTLGRAPLPRWVLHGSYIGVRARNYRRKACVPWHDQLLSSIAERHYGWAIPARRTYLATRSRCVCDMQEMRTGDIGNTQVGHRLSCDDYHLLSLVSCYGCWSQATGPGSCVWGCEQGNKETASQISDCYLAESSWQKTCNRTRAFQPIPSREIFRFTRDECVCFTRKSMHFWRLDGCRGLTSWH